MSAGFDDGKDDGAMRTIGEVAEALGIKTHVLRYWEQQFPMLQPLKRTGGRRYYRIQDIELVQRIHRLVNDDGYTLKGARKVITAEKSQNVAGNVTCSDASAGDSGAIANRQDVGKADDDKVGPVSTDAVSTDAVSTDAVSTDMTGAAPFPLPEGSELPTDGGVGRFFGDDLGDETDDIDGKTVLSGSQGVESSDGIVESTEEIVELSAEMEVPALSDSTVVDNSLLRGEILSRLKAIRVELAEAISQ